MVALDVKKGFLLMQFLKKALIIISIFVIISPTAYANKNEEVTLWVAQTLVKTLSISYTSQPNDFEEVKKNYSFNAWDAILGFLGQHKSKIQSDQLTLHPVLGGAPSIVKSGNNNGIHFWRINQLIILPEFRATIDFDLIVLARDPASAYPYVIQGINMKITPKSR